MENSHHGLIHSYTCPLYMTELKYRVCSLEVAEYNSSNCVCRARKQKKSNALNNGYDLSTPMIDGRRHSNSASTERHASKAPSRSKAPSDYLRTTEYLSKPHGLPQSPASSHSFVSVESDQMSGRQSESLASDRTVNQISFNGDHQLFTKCGSSDKIGPNLSPLNYKCLNSFITDANDISPHSQPLETNTKSIGTKSKSSQMNSVGRSDSAAKSKASLSVKSRKSEASKDVSCKTLNRSSGDNAITIQEENFKKLMAVNCSLSKKLNSVKKSKDELSFKVEHLSEKNKILEAAFAKCQAESNKLRTRMPTSRLFCNFTVTKMYEQWVRALQDQVQSEKTHVEETMVLLERTSSKEQELSKRVCRLEDSLLLYRELLEKMVLKGGLPKDVTMPKDFDDEVLASSDQDPNSPYVKREICESLLEVNALLREEIRKATCNLEDKNELVRRLKEMLVDEVRANEDQRKKYHEEMPSFRRHAYEFHTDSDTD